MDWIAKMAEKPKKTLAEEVESIIIDQYANNKKHTTFNKQSFKSRHLPQTFRGYHFTDITPEEQEANESPFVEFMLLMPTQYEVVQICLSISVDLSKEFVKYSSYPVKHSQMLNFTSQQIVTLSRFFSFYLNPRLNVGWISIDPQSGCLTYKHANNSLGFLEKRIEKVPQDLTEFLSMEVKQIQKNWRYILPQIYSLLSISERKMLSHPFWSSKAKKPNHYESSRFYLLTEYVKHSFIEYPQMFDESSSGKNIEIRSKVLPKEEKAKKYLQWKKKQDDLNFQSKLFNKELYNILEIFYPKSTIDHQMGVVKKQLEETTLNELCQGLDVRKYMSKNQIYSKLEIHKIEKEEELSRSSFSQLKLLLIEGIIKQEQSNNVQKIQKVVSKETDPHRHKNQCQVLQYIGKGKSLFITRYFECQEKPKHIMLEYCPQKTINSYIAVNRQIISLETKLVLLSRIALGVRFLRDYGVYHNDLKPDNVLLKIIGSINKSHLLTKLIDFGQSYSKYQKDLIRRNWYHRGWTIPYAPPEQVKYAKYHEKTDVFSLGVILYEFTFGQFPAQTFRKGKELYMKEDGYRRLSSMAPEKFRDYSSPKLMQVLYMLFLRCVDPNPDHRPSIDWINIILMQVVFMSATISSI